MKTNLYIHDFGEHCYWFHIVLTYALVYTYKQVFDACETDIPIAL